MKKVLITGANSYIGTSFEKYIKENYADQYLIDTLDMIDGSWREKSFSGYDAVFHVAGIAHRKETKKNVHLYYEVNRDLAIATAKKAKLDGVKLFVFMSSMSVYGMDRGTINKETFPIPKTNYGKSKLEAEKGISILQDDLFNVAILRPPMVYGNNCKGNFQSMLRIIKCLPVFPDVDNQRSMIFIDNLSAAIVQIINNDSSGVFLPQNREKMNTTYLAMQIGMNSGKQIHKSKLLGIMVRMIVPFSKHAKKAFGSLVYDTNSELYDDVQLEESIRRSIG
ncbi:MAG: NAD-dependent epimerase/dehydratase family protein [Clostridia bacterium]|nr:NAD-dependent epimerase/dehydratase family protein [Clostridia bacterium]